MTMIEIPTANILDPPLLLRPVEPESLAYIELRDSIASEGILNSIAVRPSGDHPEKYECVDGFWRLSCARDLQLAAVPCVVKYGMTDADVLAAQLQANAIRPETRGIYFARQLKRLIKRHPEMDVAYLSQMINKTPKWIYDHLRLTEMDESAMKAVERNEMPLQNAYSLAKLPKAIQRKYLNQARAMRVREFAALASREHKRYKEALRQGRFDAYYKDEFVPQPYLRSIRKIQGELSRKTAGPLTIAKKGLTGPLDGWLAALEWVLHLDEESVEMQRRNFLQLQRKKWKDPE